MVKDSDRLSDFQIFSRKGGPYTNPLDYTSFHCPTLKRFSSIPKASLLLSVLSTSAVGILLFFFIDQASLADLLNRLGATGVITAILLYILTLLCRAWRFGIAFNQSGIGSSFRFLQVVFQHQFYNHVIPARLGELSLPLLLKQQFQFPLIQSASALVIIRIYDLITLLLACLIAMCIVAGHPEAPDWVGKISNTAIATILLLLAFMISLVFALARNRRLPFGIKALAKRWPKAITAIKFIELAWSNIQGPKKQLKLFSISVANFALLNVFFFCFMIMAQVEVSYLETLVGSSLANLTQLLPINTLGSLGSLEAGWVAGFTLIGVSAKTALTTGLTMHVLVICILGLGTIGVHISRIFFKRTLILKHDSLE